MSSQPKETLLLQTNYVVSACSMDWAVHWDDMDNLELEFDDYGAGSGMVDGRRDNLPRRHILTIVCQPDSAKHAFVAHIERKKE